MILHLSGVGKQVAAGIISKKKPALIRAGFLFWGELSVDRSEEVRVCPLGQVFALFSGVAIGEAELVTEEDPGVDHLISNLGKALIMSGVLAGRSEIGCRDRERLCISLEVE